MEKALLKCFSFLTDSSGRDVSQLSSDLSKVSLDDTKEVEIRAASESKEEILTIDSGDEKEPKKDEDRKNRRRDKRVKNKVRVPWIELGSRFA